MATHQDCFIFTTGVVGRALGSGKFSPSDVLPLSQAAYDAFCAIFGKPEAPTAIQSRSAPTAHPAQSGGPQPIGAVIPAALGDILAEAKPFAIWKDDKAYYGSDKWGPVNGKPIREVTWGEWLSMAEQGDEKALKSLHTMASSDPQAGTKWEKNNRVKISRAKAVLAILKGEPEQTPF